MTTILNSRALELMRTRTTHQNIGELVCSDDFSSVPHACSSAVPLSTAVCFGGPVRDGSPAGIHPCVVTDFFCSSSLVWVSSTSGWLRLTSGPALSFPVCSSSFQDAVINTEPGISNSRANRLYRFGSADNREWVRSQQEGCQSSPARPRETLVCTDTQRACVQARSEHGRRASLRWSRPWGAGDAVADWVLSVPRRRRRSCANPRPSREATFCVAPAPEAVGQTSAQWCQGGSLGLGGRLKLDHWCISQTPEGGDA